ncbi:MAG: hypothetical protein K0S32_967 [Bacteroidetes bacterium]|jgi:uncharacterized protein YlzI (FlbEa/FlbD family)|nr:hypothetical protein [Bacteroidota bacterium]
MSFQTDSHDLKIMIRRRRSAALLTYNMLAQKLGTTVNKGGGTILLNEGERIEVSEIEEIIQKINALKKHICIMNSELLSLESGSYGVCVKTGKFIPKEWPSPLTYAGYEQVGKSF